MPNPSVLQSDQPRQPIVWITQDNGRLNFTAARSYGRLLPLLPSTYQVQVDAGSCVELIYEKFEKEGFTIDDMIIAAGDPAIIAMAAAIAARFTGGFFNLLKFDRQQQTYYKVAIQAYVEDQYDVSSQPKDERNQNA